MRYHPDDFIALQQEVERQGGAILPDPCSGRVVRYKLPDSKDATKPSRWTRAMTVNCRHRARLALPYDPPDEVEGAALVTVCAVDDDVGRWPRFSGTVSDRSH